MWPSLHFALAFFLTWTANWLGLISWRRSKTEHWAERARLLWPVRVTAATNILLVPVIVDELHRMFFPATDSFWVVNGLAACAGSLLGNRSADREIYPQLSVREWLFQTTTMWGLRYAIWFVLIAGCIFMPSQWGWQVVLVAMFYLLAHLAIQFGLFLKYLRLVRFIRPCEARLRRIVDETSARTGVSARATWQMRGIQANAFAFPTTNEMVFSDRLLEICSDEEISAICAHEMAHLSESKIVLAGRVAGTLAFFPYIFINPLVQSLGLTGLVVSCGGVLAISRFARWLSQRMEKRADTLAITAQLDEGVYARALEKLYRENSLPAVNINNRQTHPHLYDRLVAAGITPDFPRPAKAGRFTWVGIVYLIAFGFLMSGEMDNWHIGR